MYYAEEFVEEVRQRNDIVDVISSYVNLKRSGSNYTGLCPFHNEKTPSFSVSQGKQMYYCFGCGAGGNVFTFLMEYENLTFVEALEQLAERVGMQLPERTEGGEDRKRRDTREKILQVYREAATYYYAMLKSNHGKTAYEYLKNRGLSDETITKFGLGYSDKSGSLYTYIRSKGFDDDLLRQTGLFTYKEGKGAYDKFWNRVIFPILDRNSRVIAFGGRVMGEGMPKYLNSPETLIFDKSRNLYGLNLIKGKGDKGLIICEGYMDVIALHQAGFTNVAASLGTAFTSQHSSIIKRYTDQVYLCYDSDGAGVKAALRAIPILKEAGLRVKVIDMRPFKDPDEFMKALSVEEFQERIDHAKNSFFYEVDMMKNQYDMEDPEEKTKFMNETAKKCLSFENELERNNYIEAFARQYGIRTEDFRQVVNQMGAKMVGIHYNPKEIRKEKNGVQKKDDGHRQAQKMLLTWMSDDVDLFRQLQGIISEEDFVEEPYRQAAHMMYEQYETGHGVSPAKIISYFQSKEEQSEVASLFNTDIKRITEPQEREKALNEMIKRTKRYSLDYQSRHVQDLTQLSGIIEEKKKLEKLHISLLDG